MKAFDVKKPFKLRNGHLITEHHVLSNGLIVGLVEGNAYPKWWQASGRYTLDGTMETETDLINIPTKRTVWLNVYGHFVTGPFRTEEHADEAAKGMTRLGGKSHPIEIEE